MNIISIKNISFNANAINKKEKIFREAIANFDLVINQELDLITQYTKQIGNHENEINEKKKRIRQINKTRNMLVDKLNKIQESKQKETVIESPQKTNTGFNINTCSKKPSLKKLNLNSSYQQSYSDLYNQIYNSNSLYFA